LTNLLINDTFIAMKIQINKLKCKRCSYEWYPRDPDVRRCPKCKSYYWDRERKAKNMDKRKNINKNIGNI